MASLLEKAKQVRDRLGEEDLINSIPEEERRKIYNEIDRAVTSNKMRISGSTFSFKTKRSGAKLPVFINLFSLLLIAGLGIFFYYSFNQAETRMITPSQNVSTAEGRIIQALKEESEEKLAEKNREIQSILTRLESARLDQEKLLSDSRNQAERIESDLRSIFEKELEEERLRLREEGLTEQGIRDKLRDFESQKQAEFQNELDTRLEQLQQENLAKEQALKEQIAGYEQGLLQAKTDRTAMEEELKQQYSVQNRELENERDSAVARLRSFDEQQNQEQLVMDQIFGMYSSTNEAIKSGAYDEAIGKLDSLTDFLNQEKIAALPDIAYRREIDSFMIQSLRKLVEIEKNESAPARESAADSSDVLAAVSDLVEKGNRFFEQGEMEAAREQYLTALSRVPALDSGVTRLKSIEEFDLQRERSRYKEVLTEGDRYFSSKKFESAVEKYRQALEYLENDADVVDRIVNQLLDAGEEMKLSEGKTLIASRELALLNQAKREMEERRVLLDELYVLERQFSEYRGGPESDTLDSREDLASLLNTKLLIKEVLASDSIRKEYPDLHEKMGLYLDAYGKEKEREGRDAALAEIVLMMEHISGSSNHDYPAPVSAVETEQRELFLEFLRNLKNILELSG